MRISKKVPDAWVLRVDVYTSETFSIPVTTSLTAAACLLEAVIISLITSLVISLDFTISSNDSAEHSKFQMEHRVLRMALRMKRM